ncbi:MAG: hypothetical protein NTY35_04045 [Planctomycetota bacterium]|nr:hypothetical protein [Planctomycetota bacterium]
MLTTTLDPATDAAPPCGERAARALCQRVASLRAAIDAVRGALSAEDALHAPLSGAEFELERLARDVRALVDWSLPSPVRPLECSLEEIGLAAVDALHADRRGRTLVAVERPTTRVYVDGPLASRSLARLLEHGFAGGAERAGLQLEPQETGFAAITSFDGVVLQHDECMGELEPCVSAGLAEPLARRDLARLGARLEADTKTRRTTVSFPGPEAGNRGAR